MQQFQNSTPSIEIGPGRVAMKADMYCKQCVNSVKLEPLDLDANVRKNGSRKEEISINHNKS